MRIRFPRIARVGVLFAGLAVLAAPVAVAGAAATHDPIGTGGSLASAPTPSSLVDESPRAWLVELKGSAATFRADAKKVGLTYTERFAYTRLFKGVSVSVQPSQLGKLRGLSSVKALYPVNTYSVGPTSTPSPDLATAIAMTGADIAQNELGKTGLGVKVAVMDTGIDVDHQDLGGDGVTGGAENGDSFPNARITTGFDFVGNDYNADPNSASFQPVPHPDPNPDDCNGHGTHVAGIVGAKGAVTGVAPDVTFGAYRVFGCEGSTTDDVMIAAMERVLAEGAHVLNMSIGDAFNNWPDSPTAAASDALVDAGIVVVASIGNSGTSGLYAAGAPGVGSKVIGTASYDNSHVSALTFDVPGKTGTPYLAITNVPDPPTSGTVPNEIVDVGRGCPQSGPSWNLPAADPYTADPNGKIALIVRGVCTFDGKYQRAVAAGAVGVIIRNNAAGIFAGGGVTPVAGKFLVGISQADGLAIAALAPAGRASLTWTNNRVLAALPTGGLISSFSSYGVAADLSLKPDIGAPGGLIRSTYPLENAGGGYAIVSGTSMASPHVAGAVALLKQSRPSLAASAFRSILQNSADPKPWSGNPGIGFNDFVFRQGAGMVDIDDAILSNTTVTPAKVSLGEGDGGSTTLTLSNSGSQGVTYTLGYVDGLAAGPSATSLLPFTFGIFGGDVSVATFSAPTVVVPAGGSASVSADIAVDPFFVGLGRTLYGGWITMTPQGGGQVYRVPVVGFAGDYQAIVHMPTINLGGGFQIPSISDGDLNLLPGNQGGTWDLTGPDDIPNVVIQFHHQVQRLQMQVVNASNGRPVHPVFSNFLDQQLLSRNSDPNSVFLFPWDGTRMHDNGGGTPDHRKVVPNGQYKIVVKALKALGEPSNAAHWETYTSPTITIDRP